MKFFRVLYFIFAVHSLVGSKRESERRSSMPIIRVDGPRVADVDKKRQFVKDVTNAATTLYGLPTQAIVVLLQENSPDNVGGGGQLIIDRHKSDEPST